MSVIDCFAIEQQFGTCCLRWFEKKRILLTPVSVCVRELHVESSKLAFFFEIDHSVLRLRDHEHDVVAVQLVSRVDDVVCENLLALDFATGAGS